MGWPPVGAAARKGRPPAGEIVARGHDRQRPRRKGRPPTASPRHTYKGAAPPWPALPPTQGHRRRRRRRMGQGVG
ncbi:hypothetical protein BHM03_00054983 [Ensete ventricosum]|nr:hypothetical protein BHM03_00054983 [Ensete ventricosum]